MKSRSDFTRPKDQLTEPAAGDKPPAATTRRRRATPDADLESKLAESVGEAAPPADATSDAPKKDIKQQIAELDWEGGFSTVVDTFFDIEDPRAEMESLRRFLRDDRPGSSLSYGELADRLNEAQENVMRGLELLGRASRAYAAYEGDASKIEAAMRESAREELDVMLGGKKPTIPDIEARMVAAFPDEMADLRNRRSIAKSSLEMFDELRNRLAERAKDLRNMLARSRRPEE